MTDHREFIEQIPAYALHVLDEDEARRLAAHLESCQACQTELAAYEETVVRLSDTVPLHDPPERLKARLMERIQPGSQIAPAEEPQPSWWEQVQVLLRRSAPVWAPVSAVLILGLLISNLVLWRQLNRLAVQKVVTVALVGTDAEPDASAVLVSTPEQPRGVLFVSNLTPLSDEQQYQLWLIDEDGKRDSGAVFSVDPTGQAEVDVSGQKALPEYAAFGVTIEPAGGSPGPTGQQVLGSHL